MTIKLISEKEYKKLLKIQKKYPVLTYQNEGYDNINPKDLTDKDKKQIHKIEKILKKAIVGFIRFQNYKISKKGEVRLRFQYDYGADFNSYFFQGVGYILVDELLNGFKEKDEATKSEVPTEKTK